MISIFYFMTFITSLVLSLIYIYEWHKHFEVNISLIFTLIPIANLGYLFAWNAQTKESYILAVKIIYIGSCFMIFFINMSVFRLCGIIVKRWVRTLLFLISLLMYVGVLTIGYFPVFYKRLFFQRNENRIIVAKEYGPLHTVLFVYLGIFFICSLCAILYSLHRKRQISKEILHLLILPEAVTFLGYVGTNVISKHMEITPLSYNLAQLLFLLIIRRMSLYNIDDTVIDSMVQTGETGFISIDFNHRYLGSNATAKTILPELNTLRVDQSIDSYESLKDNISHWLAHFEDDNDVSKNLFVKRNPEDEDDFQVFDVTINYLYIGSRKKGYQIFLRDDTKNQKYITLLDKYNNELEEEVSAKTDQIIEMHNNLILSMAVVVESRDNSTGGHIKRTSDGVKILINEIRKDNKFNISEEFCKDIIKAAPMHDLGKIAVDDAILRKPGRFTDEEFEKMKVHAAEGAKIVHKILKDTDDESFKIVAENVAHYHHERIDGSGYPEGLKGDEIPLEARIMAIADVYDALVSKRVYKESMSFEQANAIIMEGMGKHFDKKLEEYYIKARPKLEEYYSNL
ncbi:N-terminal 7TM region of histidine kinase [Lachnospiraceae bacterium]|nr:N-terminal 7TM region of histidine kinase [Lachnospiraceae bacterium]